MAVKLAGTRFDVDCRPNPKRQQPNGHALTISNGKLYIYVYMVYIYKIWDQYETYLGALLGNAQLSLRQAKQRP